MIFVLRLLPVPCYPCVCSSIIEPRVFTIAFAPIDFFPFRVRPAAIRNLEASTRRASGPRGAGRRGTDGRGRVRRKAHRRLTRIYGFVGLANKESARENWFLGRHSSRGTGGIGRWRRGTKTPDPPTFRISWPPSPVNATTKFITAPGEPGDARTVGNGGGGG